LKSVVVLLFKFLVTVFVNIASIFLWICMLILSANDINYFHT